jgi:hypothetical protein
VLLELGDIATLITGSNCAGNTFLVVLQLMLMEPGGVCVMGWLAA